MSAMGSFLIMLGSMGGLAALALLVSKFLGGDIKIREALTDVFKKKSTEEIKKVDAERKDIAVKITESEKITEEKKEKVKQIAEKAKKDIVETLDKDDLVELVMESDSLWGK
jgi:uncharacterized FlgJ-related protein